MPTLAEELTALKTEEDKITGNKVANFSYDDYAYEHNDANGVDTYNVDNHQNIPNGTASILKVNPTILTKGWRAQASAITRMLMNHFLGRCSYNLNKINDHFSLLLTKIMAYLEQPNGIATLNSEGKVTALNNVVNTGDSDTPVSGGTTKFTTGGAYADKTANPTRDSTKNFTAGGAYTELAKKAPIDHASMQPDYGLADSLYYGHVKFKTSVWVDHVVSPVAQIIQTNCNRFCIYINPHSQAKTLSLKNPTDSSLKVAVLFSGASATTTTITEISANSHVEVTTPENGFVMVIPMIDATYHLV